MAGPFIGEVLHAFLGGKTDLEFDRVLAGISGVIDSLRPADRIADTEFADIAAGAASVVEGFLPRP